VRTITSAEHVSTVEFSRPPLNYFDVAMVTEIADACIAARADGARAVVLASQGTVFCAGADFGELHGREPDPAALYEQAVRLFAQPLPLIAAVQGAAIGGGLGLALTADFRVASPRARFAANFTALGIHPGFGMSVTLPAVVGRQVAADLLYTSRRIGGEEALRLGLVDRLAEPDLVRDEAVRLAAHIAACAPLAVEATRATLRGGLAEQVTDAVRHEAEAQRRLFSTADFAEGVAAVRERRPGRFTGR
jgi:enoyl-CoA hydratase/carnithine racemase